MEWEGCMAVAAKHPALPLFSSLHTPRLGMRLGRVPASAVGPCSCVVVLRTFNQVPVLAVVQVGGRAGCLSPRGNVG